MIKSENFIGFSLSKESGIEIASYNAKNHEKLADIFYAATQIELNRAVILAKKAYPEFAAMNAHKRADFLEEIALEIENLGDELIEQAILESGLPEVRLKGERGRTCGQLRLFSQVLRDGDFLAASIDTALPDRKPLPKADIRLMKKALGPIAVFTASNFPLAFSTAGGDTAAALAAGCPVIIKAHESHLGVNALVAEAIVKAAEKTGMPDGVFSSLNGHGYETGSQLVMHEEIKGVAFTGSYNGGKALYDMAQKRKEPIPVFAEMGSINPVVLLPSKLSREMEEVTSLYANSITMGAGQFCTNPGLLLSVASKDLDVFKVILSEKLNAISEQSMLNKGIEENYKLLRTEALRQQGVESFMPKETLNIPTLASVSASDFLTNPQLHKEVFGPFSLLIECKDENEMIKVIDRLEGQLTGTIMGNEKDLEEFNKIAASLEHKVGRLIFNGTPTGVEVCHSMHHGGPFPASTDARFTSVGSRSIDRFLRPICYQDAPQHLLPDALKDDNPLGIFRLVDGVLTRNKI
jgi:NADP-dependent aldehyde dehydrogenase